MLLLILKICLAIYIGCMFIALLGIVKKKRNTSALKTQTNCEFSVLIPFRNEYKRLNNLLESIQQLDYPKEKFELIFIDDHSSDQSVRLIHKKLTELNILNFIIIQLDATKKGKKIALIEGIKKSKFPYIVTTDADCIVPKNWLISYNQVFSNHSVDMVIGSVCMKSKKTWLQSFQYYDYIAMQAFNIGISEIFQPVLCSGANLAYKKKLIEEIQPYKENFFVASGDDTFLLDAFIKNGLNLHVLLNPSNVVTTENSVDIQSLIQQRKRWLAKTPKSRNIFTKIISLVILLGSSAWLILCVLSLINTNLLVTFFKWTVIKLAIEFFVTLLVMKYLKLNRNSLVQLIQQFLYPFALLVVVFNIAVSKRRVWKEREF